MTRSLILKQSASVPTGAVVVLLAMALSAPPGAEGGCSHLVTSRTDPARLASQLDPSITGWADRSAPLPLPPGSRPCSGAWCSGQPAAPAIPAGMSDGRLDSWLWCPSAPALTLTRD